MSIETTSLRHDEFLHGVIELRNVFDFGAVAYALDLNYLGHRYRSAIGVDTSARNDHVARAPYQQRRRFQAAQKVRETRVVHERLPSDARGLGAGVLEGFETLGRHLAAVEFAELGGFDGIGDRREQMVAYRHREEIHDLALGRLDTHRGDQHHVRENIGVGGGHLGRDKATGRKPDYVDRLEPHFAQNLR